MSLGVGPVQVSNLLFWNALVHYAISGIKILCVGTLLSIIACWWCGNGYIVVVICFGLVVCLGEVILKPSPLITQGFEKNGTAQEKIFKHMCNFGSRAEWRKGRSVISSYLDVDTTKDQCRLLNPKPLDCIAGYIVEDQSLPLFRPTYWNLLLYSHRALRKIGQHKRSYSNTCVILGHGQSGGRG